MTLGEMRRWAREMSFGKDPKFREGEIVETIDNNTLYRAIVRSWCYLRSTNEYQYCVKLDSRDIINTKMKKESELRKIK